MFLRASGLWRHAVDAAAGRLRLAWQKAAPPKTLSWERATRPACSPYSTPAMATDEVFVQQASGCAVAVLNRPKVLNALNLSMVDRLFELYSEWDNPGNDVHCILLKGAGEKAFCAGGDVKGVVKESMKGNPEGACSFFQNEYMLDYQISQLRKPHIAVMDRITMGGGAGLSMNGPFRIATERTVFAMPECAIGLFPDVGASRFLNDLPYRMGMYMALTGARLKGAEVKAAGLATHFIESGHLSRLEPQLDALGPKARDWSVVDAVLKEAEALSTHPPMEEFMKKMNAVSSIFGKNSLAQVVEALRSGEPEHIELCQECLSAMGRGSPLSMALVFEQLTRLRDTDLANCLEIEFRLAQRCSMGDADFWEGVRAVLIDKDQNPKWKYPSIDKVPDDVVQELFEQRADLKSLNLQPRAKM